MPERPFKLFQGPNIIFAGTRQRTDFTFRGRENTVLSGLREISDWGLRTHEDEVTKVRSCSTAISRTY